MSTIVSINDAVKDTHSFSMCSCSPDEPTLVPVTINTNGKRLIVCLVCFNCQREFPVLNGFILTPNPEEG